MPEENDRLSSLGGLDRLFYVLHVQSDSCVHDLPGPPVALHARYLARYSFDSQSGA